jgi:hypothetical protein
MYPEYGSTNLQFGPWIASMAPLGIPHDPHHPSQLAGPELGPFFPAFPTEFPTSQNPVPSSFQSHGIIPDFANPYFAHTRNANQVHTPASYGAAIRESVYACIKLLPIHNVHRVDARAILWCFCSSTNDASTWPRTTGAADALRFPSRSERNVDAV